MKTKKEIRIIIDALDKLIQDLKFDGTASLLHSANGVGAMQEVFNKIGVQKCQLEKEMESAPEDFIDNILESHRTLCKVKNMDLKAAYGHNPFLYYSCGVAGEAGEICNKLVKGFRNGFSLKNAREAVRTELPDVFIYGTVLGFIADLDIQKEINDKVETVVERALSGYYGEPFKDS
jgi:NTP pyrophosphatase (non-canonical NTP hydrolase)